MPYPIQPLNTTGAPRFHVGTRAVCGVCQWDQMFVGSGSEYDDAESAAQKHERRTDHQYHQVILFAQDAHAPLKG